MKTTVKTRTLSRHARRLAIPALLACGSPLAAAEALQLQLAAQPLNRALAEFSSVSGIKTLYAADLLADRQAPAISGQLTPQQALDRLLAGSGLRYRFVATDAIRIEASPTGADAPAQLSEMVVTATRTANPIDRVAASVSVVDRARIDETQATDIAQVLNKLPSVEFGGGPRSNGEVPSIRGVFGASITLLVDGARQNDTTSPGMKTPLYLDPFNLRQVEVLRGSGSSLYGSGGIGGVMNFTTLSARDLLTDGRRQGADVRFGYNDGDNSTHSNARVYAANGMLDALLSVGYHDWNKIRQGGGSYLAPNDGNASSGLLKIGIQPAIDRRLELSHQAYQSGNLQVNNPQATEYKTANFPITMPAVQKAHIDQANTVLKGTFGDLAGTPAWSASVYQSSLKIANDSSPVPTITNVLYSDTKTVTTGANLQHTTEIADSSWGSHRITGGLDHFHDKQSAVAATAANPSAASTVIRDGTRDVTGLYLQDEIALASTWNLTPSVRGDRYEAKLGDGTLPSNSSGRVSPKLALSWHDAGWMAYGSWGEAFRAPTVNELYQNFTSMGLSNFLPNAGLLPEVDRTLEIGASFRKRALLTANDAFNWRAAVFHSRVTNLIYSANLGGMTPTGSTPAQQATYAANCASTGLNCKWQYQNIPDATRRGAELEGSYQLGDWQYDLAYSRVRVRDLSNDANIFSPPDKLSLSIRHHLARNVDLSWTTTGVAAQDYDSTVLRRRSGYATHDLFVSWQADSKLRFDVGVTNLGDKRYAVYQSSNAYANTYQEGRSLKLAINASF
jgi:hemoglobin/transferrin/lactoferrin receptor protein